MLNHPLVITVFSVLGFWLCSFLTLYNINQEYTNNLLEIDYSDTCSSDSDIDNYEPTDLFICSRD